MIPEKKENEKFSYADYLTWPDDERWELIEGEAWVMSPVPTSDHQSVSVILIVELFSQMKGKPCRLFHAPFDVRLGDTESDSDEAFFTVVQPDITVICDLSKIDKRGCLGAPDLVIEILSPSTAYKDESNKLKLYEKYGVREYWIVNPEAKYIMIYRHNGIEFDKPEYLKGDDIVRSTVVEGFELPLAEVFRY